MKKERFVKLFLKDSLAPAGFGILPREFPPELRLAGEGVGRSQSWAKKKPRLLILEGNVEPIPKNTAGRKKKRKST